VQPTKDLTCIGEQPLGWGTVTPDGYWANQCVACITPIGLTGTPLPVPTFMIPLTQTQAAVDNLTATVTPLPSVTYTPGPFVSPTASPIPEGGMGCIQDANSICTSLDGGRHLHWEWDLYNNDYHPAVVLRYALPSYSWLGRTGRLIVNGQVSILDDSNILNNYEKKYRYFSNGISEQWDITVSGNTYDLSIDTPATFLGTYYLTVAVLFYNKYADYASTKGFADLYAPYVSVPLPSPTPTPTSTPSGAYCASVVPASDLSDNGFLLPVPGLGALTCPIDFAPVTVPLFGMFGWDDIQTSAVKICVQEITFGHLLYYGLDFDLDYISYIIAAAAILRMILRS
jgi:hypothetical protein